MDKKTFGLIILAAVITVFFPFILFILGCFTGLLIEITFGELFVKGLSLLHISIDKTQIPLLCGIIAIIGSFFRNTMNVNNKKGNN